MRVQSGRFLLRDGLRRRLRLAALLVARRRLFSLENVLLVLKVSTAAGLREEQRHRDVVQSVCVLVRVHHRVRRALASPFASLGSDNPILTEPRAPSRRRHRRRVVARDLAHLLDVTGRHDSLSESSNRALRVFVLTHSHLIRARRHRSPSSSSVTASSSSSSPRASPSVVRAHLRLVRALKREEVGKSTENERHRECVRVVE